METKRPEAPIICECGNTTFHAVETQTEFQGWLCHGCGKMYSQPPVHAVIKPGQKPLMGSVEIPQMQPTMRLRWARVRDFEVDMRISPLTRGYGSIHGDYALQQLWTDGAGKEEWRDIETEV